MKIKGHYIHIKSAGVVLDNASKIMKTFKESASTEVSEDEDVDENNDDPITIKSAGEILDLRLDSHCRCVITHTYSLTLSSFLSFPFSFSFSVFLFSLFTFPSFFSNQPTIRKYNSFYQSTLAKIPSCLE